MLRLRSPSLLADRGTRGLALVVLSSCTYSLSTLLAKGAIGAGVPVPLLLAGRFVVGAALLWLLLLALRMPWRVPPTTAAALLLLGLGGQVPQSLAMFLALERLPASLATVLLYLYPSFVLLIGLAAGLERLHGGRLVALALATAGAVLVVGPLGEGGDLLGVLFALAAAALLAGYVLLAPRLMGDAPALVATAYVSTAAALGYLLYAAALGWPAAGVGAEGWLLVPGLAAATVLAAVLFLAGLARAGSARGSIVATIELPVTMVLAALLLGDRPGLPQLLGAALILVAVVLTQVASARATKPEPSAPPAPASSRGWR